MFDGASDWKLHLLQFGLILNFSLGVLMMSVRVIHLQLSHRAQESLRQFTIDLIHSLWLIGYLIQLLTYPGTSVGIFSHACIIQAIFFHHVAWFVINSLQNVIGYAFKRISDSENLIITGQEFPPGHRGLCT